MIIHLDEFPSLSDDTRLSLRSTTIIPIVELLYGYLLATVLLNFSLGLYELIISKIGHAVNAKNVSQVLVIHSLGDLTARLYKVIVMILIVKHFEHAFDMKLVTTLDLLAFADGTAFIGFALFLLDISYKHNKLISRIIFRHKKGELSSPFLLL